jgi:hypothetical protein
VLCRGWPHDLHCSDLTPELRVTVLHGFIHVCLVATPQFCTPLGCDLVGPNFLCSCRILGHFLQFSLQQDCSVGEADSFFPLQYDNFAVFPDI